MESRLLFKNQRIDVKQIGNYGRLRHLDVIRLANCCDGNIFESKCVGYNGLIKNNTPLFSYKSKKVSLLRLMYHNFKGDVVKGDEIKCDCEIHCVNINHIYKKNVE